MDKYLSYLSFPPLLRYYSSLWSPVTHRGGQRRDKRKRKEQDKEFFNVQVRQSWEALDTLPIQTHRRPDGQMDGRVDDSLPGAQTSQDSSAESHKYQSNKVCEQLLLTGKDVHVVQVCNCQRLNVSM